MVCCDCDQGRFIVEGEKIRHRAQNTLLPPSIHFLLVACSFTLQVCRLWARFHVGFVELWSDEALHTGQAYLRPVYPDNADLEEAHLRYMHRLWQVIWWSVRVARVHPQPSCLSQAG